MAGELYLVQAHHYAQWDPDGDVDDEGYASSVMIHDEEDTNETMVGIRTSLELAERLGEEWNELSRPREDGEQPWDAPVAVINIYRIPTEGPCNEPGKWVKSTVDNT